MSEQETRPKPDGLKPGGQTNDWLPGRIQAMFWYLLIMLGLLWFWQEASRQLDTRTIAYSEFKKLLTDGRVENAVVEESAITGTVRAAHPQPSPDTPTTNAGHTGPGSLSTNAALSAADATFKFRTVRVEDPDLVKELETAGVEFVGVRPAFLTRMLWAWILPIAFMILIWRLLARGMGKLGPGLMGFASSKARLAPEVGTGVSFKDVAGCEEAKTELQEIVTFLKDPARYRALGAQIPKGVLLVGPPGTGKTLLARAVAGEASVPFFSINGSEFVEMFVGVGAARVRDLFQQAKAQTPCIVFIDELDAVGRQRGVHTIQVNDEREQTLNQLLVGLDGFEGNEGVIVLAATNRPEVLDRALLRPGRFDRQVIVDAPDLEGRLAILKLHTRDKPLADEVDLRRIAQATPGFSGADLANLVNEAALLAARRAARLLTPADLQDAVEKVVAGPERRSRRLTDSDKRRVAYHETGHALVAAHCPHADSLHKISIVPRGRAALGYTLQLPETDRYLMSQSELLDKIKGLLGGRAAEEIVFGEITTGAENDLEQATALARRMVCAFGMGTSLGLVHCAPNSNPFLEHAPPSGLPLGRDCSDQTAAAIDQEVKKILDNAYTATRRILQEHRRELDRIAIALLERETLDAAAFQQLLRPSPPPSTPPHALLQPSPETAPPPASKSA